MTNPKNLPAIFFIPHERAILLVKCDFSYSCAAADKISTDLRRRAVPLLYLSLLYQMPMSRPVRVLTIVRNLTIRPRSVQSALRSALRKLVHSRVVQLPIGEVLLRTTAFVKLFSLYIILFTDTVIRNSNHSEYKHSLAFRVRGYAAYSNETRAPIGNPPNSAQLEGTPYHSSTHIRDCAVVWECGE